MLIINHQNPNPHLHSNKLDIPNYQFFQHLVSEQSVPSTLCQIAPVYTSSHLSSLLTILKIQHSYQSLKVEVTEVDQAALSPLPLLVISPIRIIFKNIP